MNEPKRFHIEPFSWLQITEPLKRESYIYILKITVQINVNWIELKEEQPWRLAVKLYCKHVSRTIAMLNQFWWNTERPVSIPGPILLCECRQSPFRHENKCFSCFLKLHFDNILFTWDTCLPNMMTSKMADMLRWGQAAIDFPCHRNKEKATFIQSPPALWNTIINDHSRCAGVGRQTGSPWQSFLLF